MAEQFSEQVEILDATGNVTIVLDATKAQVKMGGHGQGGDVNLFASGDSDPTVLNAKIRLDGEDARARFGGNETDGIVVLYPASETSVSNDDRASILLAADNALARFGGKGIDGHIRLYPAGATQLGDPTQASILLNAGDASLRLGGKRRDGTGVDGDVVLFSSSESPPDKSRATIYLSGSTGNGRLGGHGKDGKLKLFPATADDVTDDANASILLNAEDASLRMGGIVALFRGDVTDDIDEASIYLDAEESYVRCGGNVNGGKLELFRSNTGTNVIAPIALDAEYGLVRVGGEGINGQVAVLDAQTNTRITLDGGTGQILFENADVAEQFNVGPTALAPGTVVAFVDEETVIPATDPYDPRVAGVIAGAGGYRPGMVLGYMARGNRQAVSVFGKACCMVDSSYGPIRTGDLLVVSPTPGHAMRATDRLRAFGATLGKALRDFDGGCGMIPVLITLR